MTTETGSRYSATHLGGGQSYISHSLNLNNNICNNSQIEIISNNFSNNNNLSFVETERTITNNICKENTNSSLNRKPSYVGLSCTVSGYSDFTRYQSPSRKTGGPSAIPVVSPPQILDCNDYHLFNMRRPFDDANKPVRGQVDLNPGENHSQGYRHYFRSSQGKVISPANGNRNGEPSVESGLRLYGQHSLREESPSSDTSSSAGSLGSGNGNVGSIVQKQIERLFGSSIQSIRITSPEPRYLKNGELSMLDSESISRKIELERQEHCNNNTAGLSNSSFDAYQHPQDDFYSKIPAVFKLLRPEFLQQLKLNNCQIRSSTDQMSSKKKGIIISNLSQEEVKTTTSGLGKTTEFPKDDEDTQIVGDGIDKVKNTSFEYQDVPQEDERFVPNKPVLFDEPLQNLAKLKTHNSVISVPEVLDSPSTYPKVEILGTEKVIPEFLDSRDLARRGLESQDESDDPFNVDRFVRSSTSPPGGVRERALLCPIKEEDVELSINNPAPARLSVSRKASPILDSERSLGDSLGIIEPKKPDPAQDGHYFIKILENEIFRFEEKICDFEEDLSDDNNIPEEVRDSILAGIGKAKLLIAQKFKQFRGLCHKNISQNSQDDPYVPNSEDLAGFWDMVYLQVKDINSLFAELSELKQNNWQPKADSAKIRKPVARKKVKSPSAGSNCPNSVKVSEASKARELARKKMIEEKKRLMRQNQLASNDRVELFIPTV